MQRFLYLEVLDPEVHAVLAGLQREFATKSKRTRVHVTVRGPYSDPLPADQIRRLEKTVQNEPLLIYGPGVFHAAGKAFVFLRIHSEALRAIWYKPDFPIGTFGFNPHVTLHEGTDEKLANLILKFLTNEDLRLVCHEFCLLEHTSKQEDLFGHPHIPTDEHFLGLSNRRLVRADILQRAENIVKAYRKHG